MAEQTPSLEGKVCIVTGANTGIGKEVARGLAKFKATVFFACRTEARTLPAIEEIKKDTGNENLFFLQLDLASFESIRACAVEFKSKNLPLHILVNNAGIFLPEPGRTKDGFEVVMGTNHLGPFLFTNLLLDKLKQSAPSRIVNVASSAHRWGGGIDLNDINSEKSGIGPYGFSVYGRSKLANILFTVELHKRLAQENLGQAVHVSAMHPGAVKTELGRAGDSSVIGKIVGALTCLFFRTPAKGAETVLYLASSSSVEGKSGKYWVDKQEEEPYETAKDAVMATKLWELSARLTGLVETSSQETTTTQA